VPPPENKSSTNIVEDVGRSIQKLNSVMLEPTIDPKVCSIEASSVVNTYQPPSWGDADPRTHGRIPEIAVRVQGLISLSSKLGLRSTVLAGLILAKQRRKMSE
jgi:hypothetical protein